MNLNTTIIQILTFLHQEGNKEVKSVLHREKKGISLLSNGEILVRITPDSILLFDRHNVQNKIRSTIKKQENTLDLAKVEKLLTIISASIEVLDHVGISYICKDLDSELKEFAAEASRSKFEIYDGESPYKAERWYFIGDRKNWSSPLFEVVLSNKNTALYKKWTPHFQIHINTTLKAEELEKHLIDIYGTGFEWVLDLPDLGKLLGMKILGEVEGTKICIGLGTCMNSMEIHRKEVLKDIMIN